MTLDLETQADLDETLDEEFKALFTQARALMTQSKWDEALAAYDTIIARQREAGDELAIAKTRNDVASIHLARQQWAEALAILDEVLPVLRAADAHTEEAVALNNLAAAHTELGDTARALEVYQEALALRQEMADPVGEAKTLRNIGVLYAKQGQMVPAKNYLNKAVIVAKRSGAGGLVGIIRQSLSQLGRRRK